MITTLIVGTVGVHILSSALGFSIHSVVMGWMLGAWAAIQLVEN